MQWAENFRSYSAVILSDKEINIGYNTILFNNISYAISLLLKDKYRTTTAYIHLVQRLNKVQCVTPDIIKFKLSLILYPIINLQIVKFFYTIVRKALTPRKYIFLIRKLIKHRWFHD